MFIWIIIGIFVLIIAIIIYFEYKNEKDYQENRRNRAEDRKKTKPPYSSKEKIKKPSKEKNEKAAKVKAKPPRPKERSLPQEKKETASNVYELKNEKISVVEPRKVPSAKELKEEEEKKLKEERLKKEKNEEQRLEEKNLEVQKPEPESIPEPVVTKKIDLPECNYPKFDHSRLVEMGLSDDEAKEFVAELIPQLETQIPLIKEAMGISDFHNMERLTHSIKGSSTTVGTGGISDLLVEFNTYIKTGREPAIIEAYFEHLKHYSQELKEQYS